MTITAFTIANSIIAACLDVKLDGMICVMFVCRLAMQYLMYLRKNKDKCSTFLYFGDSANFVLVPSDGHRDSFKFRLGVHLSTNSSVPTHAPRSGSPSCSTKIMLKTFMIECLFRFHLHVFGF